MPPEDTPPRPKLRRTSTSLDAELEKIHRCLSPTSLQLSADASLDDNHTNITSPMTNFEAQISSRLRKVSFNDDQETANKARMDSGVEFGPDDQPVSHPEDDRSGIPTWHGSGAPEGDLDLSAAANTDGTGNEQLLHTLLRSRLLSSGSKPQNPFSSGPPSRRMSSTTTIGSDDEAGWDIQSILDITNKWRQTLASGAIPDHDELELMNQILLEFLASESNPSLLVIVASRLHKLLEAVIDMELSRSPVHDDGDMFDMVAEKAKSLERKWQKSSKGKLFNMDDDRIASLSLKEGPLHHVYLDPSPKGSDPQWKIAKTEYENVETTKEFEPGTWWLNPTCACRDSIIDNDRGYVTMCPHGLPSIALLRGEEIPTNQENVTKYCHEGPMKEMMVTLLTRLDKSIKVLRGYTLKSKFAPTAGTRYDGRYIIRSYSHKRISSEDDTFRLELTLEREPGQRSMDEVALFPSPSQIDDWDLYMTMRDDDVKNRCDVASYENWHKQEAEEEIRKVEWLRKLSVVPSGMGF